MINPNSRGTLIPIGGNEDKGNNENASENYTLDFIGEGILATVVKESGGKDSRIVVIPCASSIPEEVGQNYMDAFGKLGCTNVSVLDIRSREDSEKPENIAEVKKANCIMFSGGDQSKITDRIGDTTIHDVLIQRYHYEDGFVIAGTSAGAMAMSRAMIAGGSSTESLLKGAVKMYRGLGLMPNVMFDTHFIQRGRFGRVAEAVAIHPELIGIGLAEDTGLVIKKGNDMRVIGSGMVIIFDGSTLTHNNQKILKEATPMTIVNLTVHILSKGDQFFVDKRKVVPLPVEEPFE